MAGRFSVEAVFKAVDRITAPVSRMQNRIGRFARSAERGLRGANRAVDSFIGGLRKAGGSVLKFGAIGIGALTAGVGLLVREYSKIENAEAAFTPLLGGAERAKQAIAALNETAASTPFQFETLADAANQLLPVMDGNIENTIKTIRMLGDTAGGNAQKLDSITRGFTKAMLKGKVDMESLNMIAEAGVPIFGDLADVIGVEMGPAFFKMVSAGKVTTKQLTQAFEKMTGEGGLFFNGMQIASKTTTGMFSTLKDNISLTAAELGSTLAPTVKNLIQIATEAAQKVREWVIANRELIQARVDKFVASVTEAIKGFIARVKDANREGDLLQRFVDVVFKIGNAIAWLASNGATIAKVIGTVIALSLVLKTLAGVIWLVNVAMAANPIGLIIIGVALLIAAVAAAIIWWDELKAKFNEAPGWMQALISPIGFLIANFETIKGALESTGGYLATLGRRFMAFGAMVFDKVVGALTWLRDSFLDLPGPIQAAVALIAGPVGVLAAGAALITDNWGGIVEFFSDLWGSVTGIFDASLDRIMGVVNKVKAAGSAIGNTASNIGGGVAGFFGFGDDDEQTGGGRSGATGPQVVSPQERTARSIEETRSTNSSEVTIRDETGRAEVTRGQLGGGLLMVPSGGF